MEAGEEVIIETEDRFIELWGEISSLWGVNRSIGRIHALLYLSDNPLDAETIGRRLQISHGNCSTSIRELITWGVLRRVRRSGERKALYESEQDPWTWFHTTIKERRRREVLPVVEALREVAKRSEVETKKAKGEPKKQMQRTNDRIQRFLKFNEEFVDLIDAYLAVGAGPLGKALRLVAKLIPKRKRA